MMNIKSVSFNIYLLLIMAVVPGCETTSSSTKSSKEFSTLRIHQVINNEGSERCLPITVYSKFPMKLYIDRTPEIHERYVKSARVMNVMGTYELEITFNGKGAQLLHNLTIEQKSKRVAIYSDFGQSRWLAAPILSQRITNGVFSFTPDATREEAERIARGLNYTAEKNETNKE